MENTRVIDVINKTNIDYHQQSKFLKKVQGIKKFNKRNNIIGDNPGITKKCAHPIL